MKTVRVFTWQVTTCAFLPLVAGCSLDSRFVYFPTPWESRDWAVVSGLPIQDVVFKTSDGVRLHGWMIPAADDARWILWCHGNAGTMIHRLENIREIHRRNISVFIFDYRGYGQSSGTPSEDGLYRDALAVYDVLTQQYRVPPEHLVLFGRSLGAAVATDLATKRKAAGLILETPFSSVTQMFKATHTPLVLRPLIRARYDVIRRLPQVRMPVLVLHGDHDEVIPLALGQQVFEAASPPKDFYLIRGASHNDTYVVGGESYFQRLLSFIHDVTAHSAAKKQSLNP